jgi:dihydroorotate dehydrogenase
VRATDPSLATSLCGIAPRNPVPAASGTLSSKPIEGNPPARLYGTSGVRRPRPGAGFGGLSAPAIKPIALRMVYQAVRAVKIPVAGMGDISTGRDAAEFMIAGASAVQVGTANSGTRACRCASRRNWRA